MKQQKTKVNPSTYSITMNSDEIIIEEDTIENVLEIEGIVVDSYVKPKNYFKFYTPSSVADTMVDLLELKPFHSVLEPSAGTGNLIKAVHRKFTNVIVDYFEIDNMINMHTFMHNHHVVSRGDDFITYSVPKYDRIIANPPFDDDKWLKHTFKMYKSLVSRGIMVSIVPLKSVNKNNNEVDNFYKKVRELCSEFIPLKGWAINDDNTITEIQLLKLRKL